MLAARLATLSLLLLLGEASSARADDGWRLVHREDGIEIHRRQVQGTRHLEFRGRGVIDAPLPRLLGVLRDDARRSEWTERCVDARIIEQMGPRRVISYNRTAAPWPVADRDVVLLAETTADVAARVVRVSFQSVEDPRMPPQRGVVRMPLLRGHWIFAPQRGGAATYVEYQILADTGGALPVWMANLASKTLPLKTIQGMRRQAQRRQYPEFEAFLRQQPEYRGFLGD